MVQTDYLSLFKRQMQRVIIDAIRRRSGATAVDLGRLTGLPQHTIASIVADLEREGWLATASGLSSTGPLYRLAHDCGYCLGVDLGGTKVAGALADFTGRIVAEATEPTDPRGGRHVIDQIIGLATKLSASIQASKIESVMVGVPGAIDPRSGRISLVPNIDGLADLNVGQYLRNHFGGVVAIENDANLAILGELAQGCARECRNAALLAIGTGVGLGLVIEGKLVRGASGAAGEIGYLPIGQDLTSPAALSTGAFELEVGSLAMVKRYRVQGSASVSTAREIFARLHEGDVVAESVLNSIARSVALAVTALQSILDLELVVLGGSIGARAELVERVQHSIVRVFSRSVRVVASDLGSRAGIIGAASGAVSALHEHHFGQPVFSNDPSSQMLTFASATTSTSLQDCAAG